MSDPVNLVAISTGLDGDLYHVTHGGRQVRGWLGTSEMVQHVLTEADGHPIRHLTIVGHGVALLKDGEEETFGEWLLRHHVPEHLRGIGIQLGYENRHILARETFQHHQSHLARLHGFFTQDARVTFLACELGKDPELMRQLAQTFGVPVEASLVGNPVVGLSADRITPQLATPYVRCYPNWDGCTLHGDTSTFVMTEQLLTNTDATPWQLLAPLLHPTRDMPVEHGAATFVEAVEGLRVAIEHMTHDPSHAGKQVAVPDKWQTTGAISAVEGLLVAVEHLGTHAVREFAQSFWHDEADDHEAVHPTEGKHPADGAKTEGPHRQDHDAPATALKLVAEHVGHEVVRQFVELFWQPAESGTTPADDDEDASAQHGAGGSASHGATNDKGIVSHKPWDDEGPGGGQASAEPDATNASADHQDGGAGNGGGSGTELKHAAGVHKPWEDDGDSQEAGDDDHENSGDGG